MTKGNKTKQQIIKTECISKDGATYKYSLYVSERDKVASFRLPLYSIRIDMTDSDKKETSASIDNVFCDIGKAIVFFDMLVKSLATPIDLPYILEDKITL